MQFLYLICLLGNIATNRLSMRKPSEASSTFDLISEKEATPSQYSVAVSTSDGTNL